MAPDPAKLDDRTATLAPRGKVDVAAPAVTDPEPELPIDDPDRYEQITEHARGGLGRIVRAVDRRLGRTVAVKELLRRDDWHEARFVREALITARLEHPGIVPVHEAGRWPNGDPYYVMKLVEGRTLKELMASHVSVRDRLALLPHVIALADAVGYAHSEGVVHRDVKPSNVIVGAFGETIVVDWGLARDCKRDIAEPEAELIVAAGSGVSTISGKIVGTPAYMAPEQARGEIVDARADVYAIGAVLYELLAGKAPHADDTPQAMLDRVIAGPPTPLATVAPGVPSELADLVAKAMDRMPADRYANATALAEDLRRFQTGKLVSAHAYTPWKLVRKKLAQHRGVVAVAIASTIALGGIGVESFRTVVAERDIARGERARAEDARRSAEDGKRELVLVQAETSLRKDPTAALAWLKLDPVSERDLAEVVDVIDEATAIGSARHVFRPGDWVFDAAFTPDGKTVVAAVRDSVIRAYDVETGTMREIGRTPSDPQALAISPDGQFAVTGGALGEVIEWPLHGGPSNKLVDHGKPVTSIRFDPDGTRLVVERTGRDEILALADGTVTPIGPSSAKYVKIAAGNWDKRVALVAPNQVAVVEGTTTRPVAQTDRAIDYLALSPTGDTILLHDGQSVWTVPYTGGALTKLAAYDGMINDIAWAPDHQTGVVIGKRPDILLFDLATHVTRELRGHTDQIYSAVFTHDGRGMLTASDDGTARVWNLADDSSIELRGHDDDVYRARLSPDERFAATASLDGSLRVWPIANSDVRVLLEGAPIDELELLGDRALVKTSTALASWDLETGHREPLVSWKQGLGLGVPSPDGERLLAVGPAWTLELRGRDGAAPLVLKGHRGLISHVEWSRDSKTAYSSSYDGTLRRWDLATGTSTTLVEGDVPVRGFAVAADHRVAAQVGESAVMIYPDGRAETLGTGPSWCVTTAMFDRVRDRLLIQRCDHGLGLYDGKHQIDLPTGGYHIERLAVSPDGGRIAGAMGDRTIRVWDVAGKLLTVLRGHGDLVMDVAFSPDGSKLASASYDKTIRIWELATGRHRVLRGHSGAVQRVAWRGAGQLVTASVDGTVRVWPVPATTLPSQAEVTRRLDAATTARIDAQNRATTAGG